MVAETFGVSTVSIWLLDEAKGIFSPSGSTAFSNGQAKSLKLPEEGASAIFSTMQKQRGAIDFNHSQNSWAEELKRANPDHFQDDRIFYLIPLVINENLLGLLTLNKRMTGRAFSIEDFDLLKTIADQTAGSLLNLKLSADLRQMKEIEAFQAMSAFVMHDLKNLASTLSLTMQNLPIHFDNPEFRNDAMRITQQSLNKINNICAGLSSLSQKIEIKKISIDLNELLTAAFAGLNGCIKTKLIQDLKPMPKLFIDPEQIRKVLTNLILNANEAVGNDGEIQVGIKQNDGWVVLSVSDNGCGMSKEFVERSLFRPFKTTKKQGMGIGLFQSKMIIEAHGGGIEVESEENVGTTFRVLLPISGK